MPYQPLNPFPNPFVDAPFVHREKGFGERLGDDIANLSIKQTLGMPLSVPLQAGVGALKGTTFGLLDFTEEAEDALGDFALPETISDTLHIAGEIGGSFVPYIGASKVAHRLFQGLGKAADLARGATTFGAPELVRQALTQEFSPQAGARSLATGAAFALPLPRIRLAPVVVGTELLFGAEPLEAVTAGLFAGLFGSMSKRPKAVVEEVPTQKLLQAGEIQKPQKLLAANAGPSSLGYKPPRTGAPVAPDPGFRPGSSVPAGVSGVRSSTAPGVISLPSHFTAGAKIAQDGLPPMPEPPMNVLREVMDDISLNKAGTLTKGERTAVAAVASDSGLVGGQRQLFPAQGAKSQVEVLHGLTAANAGTKAGENLAKFTRQVEADVATFTPAQLSLKLDTQVRTLGPMAQETNVTRAAYAESIGHFVAAKSNATNPLHAVKQTRGVHMIEQDPGKNPFIMRAETQKLLTTLRGGPREAQLKAQQIEDIMLEATETVRRARGRGVEPTPGKIAELTMKMEAALASRNVGVQSSDDAVNLMRNMMNQHTTPEAVLALAHDPPAEILKAFPNGAKRFQQMAEDRAQVLKYVFEETGAKQFRPETRRVPAGLDELRRRASDHGVQVTSQARFTKGKARPHPSTAGREVIDSFQMTLGGQNVRKFASVKEATKWLHELEAGPPPRTPTSIIKHVKEQQATLESKGTVRLFTGTSGDSATAIQQGGFQGFSPEKQALAGAERAGFTAAEWRELPGQLRNTLSRDVFGKQTTRKQVFATSDPNLASNYAGSGGELASAVARRAIDVKAAMNAGWVPTNNPKDALRFLRENKLPRPSLTFEHELAPLQATVLEIEVRNLTGAQKTILRDRLRRASRDVEEMGLTGDTKQMQLRAQGYLEEMGFKPSQLKVINRVDDPVSYFGATEPGQVRSIHELRALAHPRSIDVVYNGNGTITLTNTMSGETVQGVRNMKEALEVVRQAPNIASASREIGPLLPPGHPPLSGTGSIGSIAAEQPPPASMCGLPASEEL